MKYRYLKSINKDVSRLCFGTLTISPMQKDFDIKKGADLLNMACDLGVNFFDTAEIYGTYKFIKRALAKKDVVIATKSYAYDKKTAEKSLIKYLKESGRDRAEFFLLHEQESVHTLRGHAEAIEYFLTMKQKGLIGAFGISTHYIAGVKAATKLNEISVIHPLVNISGIGIADGSRDEMIEAIKTAHEAGKDIYAMKPLGGGHLIQNTRESFDYLLGKDFIDSIAVGVQSYEELRYNCDYFSGILPSEELSKNLSTKKRQILIQDWCEGCGKCVKACKSKALYIKDGKAAVFQDKCVFCAYCARVCPQFSIKVI
ncbi:MAG: aldo/keto reductase [Eubacteriales bacterium]